MLYYHNYYYTFAKVKQKYLNNYYYYYYFNLLIITQFILSSSSNVNAYLQNRIFENPTVLLQSPFTSSALSPYTSSLSSLPVDQSLINSNQQQSVISQSSQQQQQQQQQQVFEQKCQPVTSGLCNIDKYSTLVPFNNTLGHNSIEKAEAELHKYTYLFTKQHCKKNIQLFLCSLYTPVCVNSPSLEPKLINNILLPCRDICESAKLACLQHLKAANIQEWPIEWDCKKFNYYNQDKLCVINNTNDTSNPQQSSKIEKSEGSFFNDSSLRIDETDPSILANNINNNNECSVDQFDCKINDGGMKLLCIDRGLVCNGKKDCLRNDTSNGIGPDEGRDEADCETDCNEGELKCDDKCLSKQDICNGFVDCSSGADELYCYDYVYGVIQSFLFIFGLFCSIYICIKCFKLESKKTQSTPTTSTTTAIDHINNLHHQKDDGIIHSNLLKINGDISNLDNLNNHHHHHHLDIDSHFNDTNHHLPLDEEEFNHHFSARNSLTRYPIYQEPAYSVATRSDYERLNTGGCSGASSVYMCCSGVNGGSIYQSSTTMPSFRSRYDYDTELPPAAPPPTPAIQSIYSTGSITRLAELYVNLKSPHGTDLLD